MRLLTDPQPAIEWFVTGGSVCIGVEGVERRELEHPRDQRPPRAMPFKRPAHFPAVKGHV